MEASPTTAAISTRALTKHYGSVEALTDLTLDVRQGEIFGFLGPNGAGKSPPTSRSSRAASRTGEPSSAIDSSCRRRS